MEIVTMTLRIRYADHSEPQTKLPAQAVNVVRIDAAHTCALLGCSRATLYNLVKNKGFPQPRYLGLKRLWLKGEVEKWVEEHLTDAPSTKNFSKAA